MTGNKKIPPTGQLRQSQVLTTFGPGSMVDLPNNSVLIGGLDHWYGPRRRIYEERLESRVSDILGVPDVALYEPPVQVGDFSEARTGIAAFEFPTWYVAQVDEKTFTDANGRVYRTRPLVPWERLVKGGYLTPERKQVAVVPVRFVQACVKGHISDIDWYGFAREDYGTDRIGQLWLDEGGAGNDFAEIFIRCERTGMRRPLAQATIPNSKILGICSGRMPWLGPRVSSPCDKPNRLLSRSASNAYFSQTLSVISIPDSDAAIKLAVDQVYDDYLQYAEDESDVARERRKRKVFNTLEGFSDEAVWAELARRKGGKAPINKSIKQAEIETLLGVPYSLGEDAPEGDFFARAKRLTGLPPDLANLLERIVLVYRLKEVIAQVGFTRFEAVAPDINGELSLGVDMAPLAREISWTPAVENRGEGIFLAFSTPAVEAWLARPGVQIRAQQLNTGYNTWAQRKGKGGEPFPTAYIMLHSLAHLLITAVSLECGYSASSIRERIYAGPDGYGILLYTGSQGSEGTLGGLVEVGRTIEDHLRRALELGRLCSNDPVCAQHDPPNPHEERFLHGAACHGCLLIAETSCERRNEFLDRALVVPTVASPDAAFFGGM